MPLLADRGICLRKIEYSETSQILSLFGREHGVVRVIAKGAHRRTKAGASKFGGGIDLLELGQAVFTHDPQKELGTLTEWTLMEGRLELRRNLRALYLGLYAAELVTLAIEENDPHPRLFDHLDVLLHELTTPAREEAFVAFEMDLLREAGFAPRLSGCCQCGRNLGPGEVYGFSFSRGGGLCRQCAAGDTERVRIDPRLLGLLRNIQQLPRHNGATMRLPRLSRHQTDPLNRLLAAYVQQVVGRASRLAEYVVKSH